MPPLPLPVLLRRYRLRRLLYPLPWLVLLIWLGRPAVVGTPAETLLFLAVLAFAGALAFVAYLALTVLGAVLGRLSLASVEIGVGTVALRRHTRWCTLTVRWLPVRCRVDWWPNRTVRLSRLRLALPTVLPVLVFLGTYVALSYGPTAARGSGFWDPTVRLAALVGLIAMLIDLRFASSLSGTIDTLRFLLRVSSAEHAEQCAPYVDRRVRIADRRLNAALRDGDPAQIRQRHAALLAVDPPEQLRFMADVGLAYAAGDFATAAYEVRRATRRDGSLRWPSALLLPVLAAKEAGQPVDIDVIEIARQTPRLFFATIDPFLSAVARTALLDGDGDTAIEWGEAAVRYQTDPLHRVDDMLVLAQCYAARGRATDAERMLARSRRIEPHNPRLPHVTRIVADDLAHRAVAHSHQAASTEQVQP